MKMHDHERSRPNLAGLASLVQQAEMKLLLAGRWPPLKPLPVFKYKTHEYRASIDFDKIRGEWVCRKTSLPSNKVQELRGGLTEITQALPQGQAEVFAEFATAEQQEQELEKDANRRLQAMLEWRENYENGALYSGLRDFLSKSQQADIDESIRLTLTARQLQCSPKNISYVFDALLKAGGKLATLIEIAQRNKTGPGEGVPAQTSEKSAPATEIFAPAPDESHIPATPESFAEEPIVSVFPEQDECSPVEQTARTVSLASKIVTPEILDADSPLSVEDLQEEVHHDSPISGSGSGVLRPGFRYSTDRNENSPSRKHVLEISGFQVAAFAVVFLFAVIGLTVGLTVGRGPLGKRLRDAQKSILAADATSPALPNRPSATTSQTSISPATNTSNTATVNPPVPDTDESRSESPSAQSLNARAANSASHVSSAGPSSTVTSRSLIDSDNSLGANRLDQATPSEEKSKESTRGSESFAKSPSADSSSSPTEKSTPSVNPEPSPGRNRSAGLVARNAPPLASAKPAHSTKAGGPISGELRNRATRRVTSATGAAPRLVPPSAILVTVPARGGKPFRVTFPEKPIAASSSIAMTSELSVLVSPQSGPAGAHKPARLQAGELVYFVWPRYSRAENRYGSAQTVKVRTTIGQLGQVLDVKLVSGSISLLPATMSAIRLWRYRPTLLNTRPVQVQQDVTVEFRPPEYLSQVRTRNTSQR